MARRLAHAARRDAAPLPAVPPCCWGIVVLHSQWAESDKDSTPPVLLPEFEIDAFLVWRTSAQHLGPTDDVGATPLGPTLNSFAGATATSPLTIISWLPATAATTASAPRSTYQPCVCESLQTPRVAGS